MDLKFTDQEKKEFKKALGWGYAKQIVEHLEKKKIRNNKGEKFTEDHVRVLFNGQINNPKFFVAVMDFVKHRKAEAKRIEQLRKSLKEVS